MTGTAVLPKEGHHELLEMFRRSTGLPSVEHEVLERADGEVLILKLQQPTERFFNLLEEARRKLLEESGRDIRATLRKYSTAQPLASSESKLLLRTLAESLTINRHSFGDDFFGRYIRSIFGAEEKVTAAANHVVFGRRGSGKSSLLLYALHQRERDEEACAWIDMQAYADRDDNRAVLDIIIDLITQAKPYLLNPNEADQHIDRLRTISSGADGASDKDVREVLPGIKRLFSSLRSPQSGVMVFLDDYHVIHQDLQPKLLSFLYSIVRGNRVWLKLSAIETLTKLWDPGTRRGLQIPDDAQPIRLDYNLTMADKAMEHIKSILDTHAHYCGLPSIRTLCNDAAVLSRLVWVAAGVPRDALNIFSQAMTKAIAKGQSRVTVTNVNIAASETVDTKLRDVQLDSSGSFDEAMSLLGEIKDFCIKREKKNAFLAEIVNDDPIFQRIRQMIDLRLLHVINEGISKHQASRRYLALILDYGFYIGIRAAKSVDLFNRDTTGVKWEELRELPVYRARAGSGA
jgi:hypothetical protein